MAKMTKLLGIRPSLRLCVSSRSLIIVPIAAGLCGGLAGCGALTSIEPTPEAVALRGSVHGGQQPVIGASIKLIAPGITGYGSAGTVLASAVTDGTGSFTLPTYTCPTGNVQTYLTATGGNPGSGTNSVLAEAAILGPCSGLTPSTFISVSEVTTIAAAYSLAPFATVTPGSTTIGTSSTNLTGLSNAVWGGRLLANSTTGQAQNSITGVTVPSTEVNTLADILAACVNTSGSTAALTPCGTLFTAATPPGGSAPTDTFQAAINIALNPGNNALALFGLATPTAPYQPTLTAAPGDFALGVVYTAYNLGTAYPQGFDIDAQGNVWIAVVVGGTFANPIGVSGLMEITPGTAVNSSGVLTTAPVLPTTSAYQPPSGAHFVAPQMVAIRGDGLVEVSDDLGPHVFAYVPPGSSASGFSFNPTFPTSSQPIGLAVDNRDMSTWVGDFQSYNLVHFSKGGQNLANSNLLPTGISPQGIAVDQSGDLFVADGDDPNNADPGITSAVQLFTPNGPVTGTETYTSTPLVMTGTGSHPSDVAVDHSGNFWVTEANNVVEYSPTLGVTGTFTTSAMVGGQPDNVFNSIEIDGLGRAFVSANSGANFQTQPGSLVVFSNNGTLLSNVNSGYGYLANGTISGYNPYYPRGLAIDASGNCWISGNPVSKVTQIIGIAAPVATPLSVQNYPTNRLGVRP